jgi:hypothetical protein
VWDDVVGVCPVESKSHDDVVVDFESRISWMIAFLLLIYLPLLKFEEIAITFSRFLADGSLSIKGLEAQSAISLALKSEALCAPIEPYFTSPPPSVVISGLSTKSLLLESDRIVASIGPDEDKTFQGDTHSHMFYSCLQLKISI